MHLETEKLLGTLEILSPNTYVWENTTQEEFSLWSLMISEGFVSLTDVELAFEHWQNIEAWGTPTNQATFEYEYAPTRSERKNDNWNETIAKERKSYYQNLLEKITHDLQSLQTYNLSVSPRIKQQNYSVSIVVAQTSEKDWLCLAPTTPNQVSCYRRDRQNLERDKTIVYHPELLASTREIIDTEIQPLLDKITPITIYGYYHGAYNYTYQHQIIAAVAKTKSEAIALALQKAEMVFIKKTTVEYASDKYNGRKLSQFMNKCLSDRTIYDISFWDIGYTYELGKTSVGDWIGKRYQSEFDYNP